MLDKDSISYPQERKKTRFSTKVNFLKKIKVNKGKLNYKITLKKVNLNAGYNRH